MGRVATLCVAVAVCVSLFAPSTAAARVPFNFIGIVGDVTTMDVYHYNQQFDNMVHEGVGTLRFGVYWASTQPYKSWSKVPGSVRYKYRDEGGVPTYWGELDRVIGGLAERHIEPLPMVYAAPRWDAYKVKGPHYANPPKKNAPYARFMATLVRRYGPGGAFWDEHPEIEPIPVRQWQIWNEPNIRPFWNIKPWDRKYVALLKESKKRIKKADPGARIVMAGLSRDAWNALEDLYRAGARGNFDIMAVHPFTRKVSGVISILKRVRSTMRRNGDGGRKLDVTEFSWPSAKGKTSIGQDISVTEKKQAQNLAAALKLLAKNRGSLKLRSVYWYTWLSRDHSHKLHFDYAGVLHLKKNGSITAKPAYAALRKTALKLEGCRSKTEVADACGF